MKFSAEVLGHFQGAGVPLRGVHAHGSPGFGILGPVGYWRDGAFRLASGSRQQKLLAALLLNVNQLVPGERIVQAIWDDTPPVTARRQIVNGMSMLRRELGSDAAGVIHRAPGGYVLRADSDRTDAGQFHALAGQARGQAATDPAAGVTLLRQALARWRGPALSGLETSYLRVAADRLEEIRTSAYADLARLELLLGDYGEALALLAEPSRQDPFREQLVAIRMVALLGEGLRPKALREYLRFRTLVIAELGIEPGRQLTWLHRAILDGASLAEVLPAVVPGYRPGPLTPGLRSHAG